MTPRRLLVPWRKIWWTISRTMRIFHMLFCTITHRCHHPLTTTVTHLVGHQRKDDGHLQKLPRISLRQYLVGWRAFHNPTRGQQCCLNTKITQQIQSSRQGWTIQLLNTSIIHALAREFPPPHNSYFAMLTLSRNTLHWYNLQDEQRAKTIPHDLR
jgi:hypothetical protein